MLNEQRRQRRAVILLTDLSQGRERIIREGDSVPGALGEAVARAFRTGVSATLEHDGSLCFINVYPPRPRFVVIGAVHISQALASMAGIAGFDMEIIDPRTAFATPDRFPGTRLYAEWPQDALEARPLDQYSALAALTHDPRIDDFPLKAALDAGCFYVGALGSRKTHAGRVERLAAAGVEPQAIARINAPIGMDIGAANPAEIAVAILAELVKSLRSRGKAKGGGG